ncbi:YAK1 [Malassezia furfur]|nr:YAK1 [Malassezia furfur]
MSSSARMRSGREASADVESAAWPSPGSDSVLDADRGTYGAVRGAYTYPDAPSDDGDDGDNDDDDGDDEDDEEDEDEYEDEEDEEDAHALDAPLEAEAGPLPGAPSEAGGAPMAEHLRHDSHYAQTMRAAGVATPESSSMTHSHSSFSSSSSSSGEDASQTASRTTAEPLSSRASSVSTATTATTTQVHVPTKRPGQPQFEGFWQVRSLDDLRPMLDNSALVMKQRRADPNGGFVSPLKALATNLHHTYHLVNPAFVYELAFNPRRVLTMPSKPMYNDGHDNEDSDYILYVNDWLGTEEGHRYLILDVLGQGTFGQVVKCQNMTTHEIVAVKVIKNKKAYFNQSMMEVTILETLNQHWDPRDEHNILRLQDTFIHAKHLCLVFELLSSNLYELIKQNSFRGLSTSLVRVFITQLLDALVVLKNAQLIHCDLKPENILLRTLQAPSIKLVDFGSACHEQQTVYTYIQSRFYRSPEVLLGVPYSSAIDMWSLGCIAAELFLGLPLFPGTSEYNQMSRIVDMLGLPPAYMLDGGRQTREFFNVHTDAFGRTSYSIKPLEQYSREHRVQEQASKQYFPGTTLPEIIRLAPISRRSGRAADTEKEMANRAAFTDFVAGLLNLDPLARWTPQQAKLHPFVTGEPFKGAWQPPPPSPPEDVRDPREYFHEPNSRYYAPGPPLEPQHAYDYAPPIAPPPAGPPAPGAFSVVVHGNEPYDVRRTTPHAHGTPHARGTPRARSDAANVSPLVPLTAAGAPHYGVATHRARHTSLMAPPPPSADAYAAPAYASPARAPRYDAERRDTRRDSQRGTPSLLPLYVNQLPPPDDGWGPAG